MEKKLISVVVPCYNEEEVLPLFYTKITEVTSEIQEKYPYLSFEYVFINDGSVDRTLKTLRAYSVLDERVKYISFSRNFGKEAAMIAGLEKSAGDYVVILDADLQHNPWLIMNMYETILNEDYDCVATRRISRKGEPKLLSFFANSFYRVINSISQTKIVPSAQDFRFMKREMVDSIISMKERNRFSKGIFSWVGFDTKYIEVENIERAAGKTTWNFWKLFKYSLEGIVAFTVAPLVWAFLAAILMILAAVITFVFASINSFEVVLTLTSVILFVGGVQLGFIGILGLYLSKSYTEIKNRPIYIIKETEDSYKNGIC